MSMLEVKDLVVSYGGIEALKGISFSVDEGQIVTLIGANGAGKSTTLRAITGLVPVKSGSIFYNGEDITRLATQKTVERGIALVPEGRRVFANLTVLENLKIGAYLRKDTRKIQEDIEYIYTLFPRLKERSWQAGGHSFRRRAADAGGRPRHDDPAQAHHDGRAQSGPCAAGGEGHFRHHRAFTGQRHHDPAH